MLDVRTYVVYSNIMTLSELRANIYKVIDGLIARGEALEFERKGFVIQITAIPKEHRTPSKRKVWKKRRDPFIGAAKELPDVSWERYWNKNSLD